MGLTQLLPSVFAFRTNAVTSLSILIYFVLLIGVIVSDPVQRAPKDTGGLNLEQAYRDLQQASVWESTGFQSSHELN